MDPRKAFLNVDANADGYHEEPNISGSIIQKKLVSRGAFGWRGDVVLEMYKNPEAKLTLLLPNDYRGVLTLHFASHDSPPVPARNREFIYEASENGRVQIKETGLIERVCYYDHFHSRYRNGVEIPTVVDAGMSNVAPNSIALRFITPVWEDHIWVYVVGTKADADQVYEAIWGDGNHFNRPVYLRLIENR
ncbi:MAG TPA: hypothetical protein VKS79_05365 [Gemmataceae bacterium]|nr:hypothetical protein [Gemmataceae bacterium]